MEIQISKTLIHIWRFIPFNICILFSCLLFVLLFFCVVVFLCCVFFCFFLVLFFLFFRGGCFSTFKTDNILK